MSLITIPEVEPGVPAETMLRESVAVRDFMLAGKSGATKRAYRTDWNSFTSWCRSRGIEPLGAAPGMVATYLAAEAMSGRKPSTIARRAAAIRYAHTLSGLDSPTVSHEVGVTLQGIRRTLGTAPGQKTAATAALVRLMADQIPPGVRGERDRAIIILGFAGAFRRSELVALNVSDIREEADGLRIMIRESKGDQEKAGQEIVIPRGTKLRPCGNGSVRQG
jgi:site-specific recombinase XerD